MYFRIAFLHTQKQNLCAHLGCDRVCVRKLTFCSHFLASSLSFWFVLISSLFLSVNDANALVDLSLQSVLASEYTPSTISDCSVALPCCACVGWLFFQCSRLLCMGHYMISNPHAQLAPGTAHACRPHNISALPCHCAPIHFPC